MIHDQCGTRITDPTRCPQCDLIWCPRCRAWFRAAVSARYLAATDAERRAVKDDAGG